MGMKEEELRARMIATLRERGILHGGEIERAFAQVPRHLFLPGVPLEKVYSGDVIPTKHASTSLRPASHACVSRPPTDGMAIPAADPSTGSSSPRAHATFRRLGS